MKYIYTWLAAYQKIAKKIADYEYDQPGLINVLETIGIEKLNDLNVGDETVKLNEIDPFTFLSFLNKFGDDKRIAFLNNLIAHWDLNEYVTDVCGIPTSDPRKVWLFPYKKDRNSKEIERLWRFYFSVMNNSVTDEQLIDILSIKGVGWAKISEGMFCLKPEVFLPFNSVVKPYLEFLDIQVNNQSFSGIEQTCAQVKTITKKPFFQISYEGWLHAEEQKKVTRYWRLGTRIGNYGDNVLSEMLDNEIASIGWGNLGDLNKIGNLNKSTLKELLAKQNYEGKNAVASRKAGEILNFVKEVSYNDYIVAMDGVKVKAIAKVLHNEYVYLPDLEFPHARIVDWIKKDISGLSFEEGLQTTLTQLIDKTNIDKINEMISVKTTQITPDVLKKEPTENYPLNQILYGPPGTGKTYKSIDKAVKIATGKSGKHPENKIVFDQLRQDGQIEFVTFHQGYSYEDFMVGIKPNIDTELLTFRPYKGIFYRLVERAKENYLASRNQRSITKSFDDVFGELIAPLENLKEVKVEMASGLFFEIKDVENGTIRFQKPNGSDTHTLSVETLRAIVDGKRDFHSGLGAYYKPLVAELKKRQQTQEPKATLNNYVLIIDEINRANISKVFGELITLLEEDKRIDADNSLAVTLPNGELNFSVPPNLYIVGTMNTADKSISLIDVALRRRFEFDGYYPDYEVLARDYLKHVPLLQKLNEAIFSRKKTADYLIGHAYFMSHGSVESILLKKIIPLLMEYFSGRIEEVSEILKYAGEEASYNTSKFKWEMISMKTLNNESANA